MNEEVQVIKIILHKDGKPETYVRDKAWDKDNKIRWYRALMKIIFKNLSHSGVHYPDKILLSLSFFLPSPSSLKGKPPMRKLT